MIKDELFDFFGISQVISAARCGELTLEKQTTLDFLSQYGASPFGGVHPLLAQDVIDFFSDPNPTLCQPMVAEYSVKLKQKLLRLCGVPRGQVILSQGGAETVEVAIKLARAATGRSFTIALDGAFHGKTMGAVQLTANSNYSDYFGIPNSYVRRLSQSSTAALDADFAKLTSDGKVNAVIVEVVQGEGGMVEIPSDWLLRLEGLCRQSGILFCVDEIQTGLGRTGTMLASKDIGLTPDIILLSKALGGGIVPIGACVVAKGVMPPDFTIFHTATFADNNFTSFIACKTLQLIESTLPHTQRSAEYLDLALQALVRQNGDVFSHASGRGLMRGLHVRASHDRESIVANFQWETGLRSYSMAAWLLRKEQLLTMPCFSKPSCLRIQPALTVTEAQVDHAIAAFEALAVIVRGSSAEASLLLSDFNDGELLPKASIRSAVSASKPIVSKNTASVTRRFQFNMHPLHSWSFMNSLPNGVDAYNVDVANRYFARQHDLGFIFSGISAPCLDIDDLELGGTRLQGRLFGINLTADQMMGLDVRQRVLLQGVMAKSAIDYGADVMGLGAFTSIISNPSFRRLDSGAVVTTGSALTAFAAVRAALSGPILKEPAKFGVVGANGSIGALCAQMLLLEALKSQNVGTLVLFSNPSNSRAGLALSKSFRRWVQGWGECDPAMTDSPIAWRGLVEIARIFSELVKFNNDVNAVPEMMQRAVEIVLGRPLLEFSLSNNLQDMACIDRLLLATNSTEELTSLYACKPGAHLFDIGMPSSVSAEWIAEAPVKVSTAGIVKGSDAYRFGHGNIVGLPPGMMLGCFAETITLAATDPEAAPFGPSISLLQAERIGRLALSVGLNPTVIPAMDCALATMVDCHSEVK